MNVPTSLSGQPAPAPGASDQQEGRPIPPTDEVPSARTLTLDPQDHLGVIESDSVDPNSDEFNGAVEILLETTTDFQWQLAALCIIVERFPNALLTTNSDKTPNARKVVDVLADSMVHKMGIAYINSILKEQPVKVQEILIRAVCRTNVMGLLATCLETPGGQQVLEKGITTAVGDKLSAVPAVDFLRQEMVQQLRTLATVITQLGNV